VKLAIQKASEEVKTWLLEGLTIQNGFVNEQLSVEDFVKLY